MTAPTTIDGAMMTDDQINDLISRLRSAAKIRKKVYGGAIADRIEWEAADAIELLSASKPAAPEGWRLVPVEPTKEMQDAAAELVPFYNRQYAAMLSAAPDAPFADSEEDAYVIKRLSTVLAEVAAALMNDDADGTATDVLAKLPKVAQKLKIEVELYRAATPAVPSPDAQDERGAWDGDSRESRTAFRSYDTIAEPVSRKTPWQIWRDACAWQARAALNPNDAAAPAQSPKNCQTGWADICHMAKHDGVTCPDDSCDIDDGIRAAPVQSVQPTSDHIKALKFASTYIQTRGYEQEAALLRDLLTAPQPSQPVEAGETQTLSDGAQYFACYLIDNCENEVIREESVQAWLGKMLASPRYHPVAAPSAVVLDDERAAFEHEERASELTRDEDGDYMNPCVQSAWEGFQKGIAHARAASPQAKVCATCNGHGMIGGPSYYAPDEGGEPCPDCATATQPAQTERALTDDAVDAVSKALRRAWQLGQTYWRQADSNSYKQQDKSDETQKVFEALVDETRAILTAAQPASGGE